MSTLSIKDLHVQVEDKEILKGLSLVVTRGRDPCADGTKRQRQKHAAGGDHGQSEVHGHFAGEILLDGRDVLVHGGG